MGWGDGVGAQGQENQAVAGPLTHRLCQAGSTCGDTVPPSLIPAQYLCPQRAWHISLNGPCANVPWWSRLNWSNWTWKGHSSQGNFPVRPKRLGLFFCSPLPLGITRRKRLQAMRGGNSLFPICLPRAGGSCRNDAPGIHVVQGQHRSMATKVPDFVHVGCLEHSTGAAPTLWSQHCFLATEELSSWATCSLSGRNQMNEVTKDMGKHEESIFLGL